jgi:hypothetical protein
MEEKRRFRRIACIEKVIFQCGEGVIEAEMLDISLKGALLELNDEAAISTGDKCRITLNLKDSDIFLQFLAELVHRRNNLVGVKFVHMDIDTLIHLRSLLEARTANPQQVMDEIAFLTNDNSS